MKKLLILLIPFLIPYLAKAQTISPQPIYVKNAIIYSMPKNEITIVSLPYTEIAQKFDTAFFSRGSNLTYNTPRLFQAGFTNPILQYFILNEALPAPVSINDSPASQASSYCTPGEKSWQPPTNNIVQYPGEFCQIYDSIIGRIKNDTSKKFDHDLDPSTPNIWADESWFVHRQDNGKRTFQYWTSNSSNYYFANHANTDWQTYFAARALAHLKGGANITPSGANGLYIDNLDVSLSRFTGHNITTVEYPTNISYIQAQLQLMTSLYSKLHSNDNNFPIYANITGTERNDTGTSWDVYKNVLDGAYKEDFLLNWGRGPYSSSLTLNQLTQAETWQASGKHFVAGAPGNLWLDCPNNNFPCVSHPKFDREARYSLAGFLLAVQPNLASFRIYNKYGDPAGTRNEDLGRYFEYPEYFYQLGQPAGSKYQTSASPLVYKRDFQCGQAILDITNTTGIITQNQNCSTPSSPKQIILDYLKTSSPSDLNQDSKVNAIDFARVASF